MRPIAPYPAMAARKVAEYIETQPRMNTPDNPDQATLEQLIAFRDALRSRFSYMFDDPEPEHELYDPFIKALIQGLDRAIEQHSAQTTGPQEISDQAQLQELLSKTMLQVEPAGNQPAPESLMFPALHDPGGSPTETDGKG